MQKGGQFSNPLFILVEQFRRSLYEEVPHPGRKEEEETMAEVESALCVP